MTSKKIEAERTVREQVMSLPEPQTRILLAYLAGTSRAAVESGLEFLAAISVEDQAPTATATQVVPVCGAVSAPAIPGQPETVYMCTEPTSHDGPGHVARLDGTEVARWAAEAETLIPCADMREHWPHGRCPGMPRHAAQEAAKANPARHLAAVPVTFNPPSRVKLACGDDYHGTEPLRPGQLTYCLRHGVKTTMATGTGLPLPGLPRMHPGGLASAVAR